MCMDGPGMRVLVLDPGSTSTKLAWFRADARRAEETVDHPPELTRAALPEQLEPRLAAVRAFVDRTDGRPPDAVVTLGGLLGPVEGGVYAIERPMLEVLRAGRFGVHASALGAMMAAQLVAERGGQALAVDPISTDELEPVARISGVPGVERWGRSHALSLKAVARLAAARLERPLEQTRQVGLHLGGGISVAAMRGGRVVDVNDAMLGMGPFSGRRAGALPIRGVLDLAFAPGASRAEVERRLVHDSGLAGYLGTSDLAEVERRAHSGDLRAREVRAAMVYQIVKEAGAMAASFDFDVHAVVITGGMLRSEWMQDELSSRLARLGPVFCYPGEREIDALAQAALRILRGEESVKVYRGAQA